MCTKLIFRVILALQVNLLFIDVLFAQNAPIYPAPVNWIKPYGYKELDQFQISGIFFANDDSSVLVFTGRGIYKIIDYNIPPWPFSKRNVANIQKDHKNGKYYYYKANAIEMLDSKSLYDDTLSSHLITLDENSLGTKHPMNNGERIMINGLSINKNGDQIYACTEKHGLFKINKNGGVAPFQLICFFKPDIGAKKMEGAIPDFPSNTIRTCYMDATGLLWLGFDKGIGTYDGNTFNIISKRDKLLTISECGKANGLVVLTETPEKEKYISWVPYRVTTNNLRQVKTRLRMEIIWSSFVDNDLDYWFGLESKLFQLKSLLFMKPGEDFAARFNSAQVNTFSGSEGFTAKRPFKMLHDKKGTLWIGTVDKGLYYLKKNPGLAVINLKQVKCHNDKNASFDIMPVEGVPPFLITWYSTNTLRTNPLSLDKYQRTPFTNLPADTFVFTITDKFGKSDKYELPIENPPKVDFSFKISKRPSNADDTDGVVDITPTGGKVDRKSYKKPYYNYRFFTEGYDNKPYNTNIPYVGWPPVRISVYDTLGCVLTRTVNFMNCDTVPKETRNIAIFYGIDDRNLNQDGKMVIDDRILKYLFACPSLKCTLTSYVYKSCKDCDEIAMSRCRNIKAYLIEKKISPERVIINTEWHIKEENKGMIDIKFGN